MADWSILFEPDFEDGVLKSAGLLRGLQKETLGLGEQGPQRTFVDQQGSSYLNTDAAHPTEV